MTTGKKRARLSIEDTAAIEFAPWADRQASAPNAETWRMLFTRYSIAHGCMFKTKPELVAAIKLVGADSFMGSIDELNEAVNLLSEFHQVIEGATTRMLIALAAVAIEEGDAS